MIYNGRFHARGRISRPEEECVHVVFILKTHHPSGLGLGQTFVVRLVIMRL